MENQINFFTIDDLWNERDKSIPVDPTKVYDPLHFWDGYGERYYKQHEKREMFQFGLNNNNPVAWMVFKMKQLGIEKVLEAGCGFGRLAPFLIDGGAAKEYYGIDFSSKILEFWKDYLHAKECDDKCPKDCKKQYTYLDKIHFENASAKNMPYEKKSMDAVITSELLTHMTSTKVDHCLREFRRIAKKYIILTERHVYPGEHPYPHIWSNDIPKLVYNLGFTVLESKFIGNGMVGIIARV